MDDHQVTEAAAVLWFTGLSGAGKSTIASAVHERLHSMRVAAEYLDGDAVRCFSPTGFTAAERDAHVRRVGFLASRLAAHGVTTVCALISPYQCSRQWVRRVCERFIEIHVATPLEECERRDVKGLYAAARRGDIRAFTGIDDPYEAPAWPELRLDTSRITVDEAVDAVLQVWTQQEMLYRQGGNAAPPESASQQTALASL